MSRTDREIWVVHWKRAAVLFLFILLLFVIGCGGGTEAAYREPVERPPVYLEAERRMSGWGESWTSVSYTFEEIGNWLAGISEE